MTKLFIPIIFIPIIFIPIIFIPIIICIVYKFTNTFIKTKYKFGDIIGTFNGVNAYSNQNDELKSKQSNYYNNIYTGVKWQCVEFVRRYLILKHSITFNNVEHAFQIPQAQFTTLNGFPVKMINELNIGSIVVWPKNYENNSPHGHVAIVINISISGINVAEQNYIDSNFSRFIHFNELQNIIIISVPTIKFGH